MTRRLALGLGATAWCLMLGVLLAYDRVLSTSVDLAHHLQVVEAFRDWVQLPTASAGYLEEMYAYPHLSHRVAWLLAGLGGSSLRALTVAGCAAAVAAWLLLLDQARRISPWVLIAAFALSLANALTLVAVWGGELVDNFFFPQMAAEAVAMAGAVLGAGLIRRSRGLFLMFAVLAVWICGGFHLLPTLKLGGALMVLLALAMFGDFQRRRRVDLKDVAGLVAIPFAVVLNPAFWELRHNSANDGVINFGAPLSLAGLTLAALALLAVGAAVLAMELRRNAREPEAAPDRASAALQLLGALAMATAGAALLQLVALQAFGEGSRYAALKHAFGVFSLLGVAAPALAWSLLGRPAAGRASGRVGLAVLAVTHAVLMAAVFVRPSQFDLTAADRTLAAVRQLKRTPGASRPEAVFLSTRAPPLINYAASVAVLHARRTENLLHILWGHGPIRPERIPAIVTPVGDPTYDRGACRMGRPVRDLVVVRPSCLPSEELVFAPGQEGARYLTRGWALPEGQGAWSIANHALIEFPLPDAAHKLQGAKIQILTSAFVPPQSPRRTVRVQLEGGAAESFVFDHDTAMAHVFVLNLTPAAAADGRAWIAFDIDAPVSPKSLGLGADPRRLGLAIERVRLLPAT